MQAAAAATGRVDLEHGSDVRLCGMQKGEKQLKVLGEKLA